MKIKSLFLSDLHLGSKHSKSKELLNFLNTIESVENIFLVGDIIDGWKIQNNKWHWKKSNNLILSKLLNFNCKIYYIPGNHDEFMKSFNHKLGNIEILNEFIYKDYLIVHGDQFDLAVKHAKWLCLIGDWSYYWIMELNYLIFHVQKLLKLKHWSLSKNIKSKLKEAVKYISNFENHLVHYAITKDCKGVICGHIHQPADKMIDNIHYLNCGDWVENNSVIIEDLENNFVLMKDLITQEL